MMKKAFVALLMICSHFCFAQESNSFPEKPKLVVGIVVDQMRYDLLWRFWDLYGDDGFKQLATEGFLCSDARYNYFLTVTAAGHASIYTGTTPALHGIVDNNWYDRESGKYIYAVSDPSVKTIGTEASSASVSPFRLMTTTITDELKLADPDSKVFSIALKDRSAIMPAGHFPDGAFWYDLKTGNFVTSSWYADSLPTWLKQFNVERKVDEYFKGDWTLLLDREKYSSSTNDTVIWENSLPGESTPAFPHHLGAGNYSQLPYTPFGNTITKDIAIEVIKNEQLGKDKATDFMCISFSATDIISHQFGPNSIETEDCYLRLDRDIADLLQFLKTHIGTEDVLVFLTADHGGAVSPGYAESKKISAGYMEGSEWFKPLNDFLSQQFGPGRWVDTIADQQVWLNRKFIASSKVNESALAQKIQDFLMQQNGVLCVTAPRYQINTCAPYVSETIMNGYMPLRSGDILYSVAPGWIDWYMEKGTSHGSVFSYDNHVPLIWFGWKISPGMSADPVVIPDIAPTICNWLRIAFPSGCTGKPITSISLSE